MKMLSLSIYTIIKIKTFHDIIMCKTAIMFQTLFCFVYHLWVYHILWLCHTAAVVNSYICSDNQIHSSHSDMLHQRSCLHMYLYMLVVKYHLSTVRILVMSFCFNKKWMKSFCLIKIFNLVDRLESLNELISIYWWCLMKIS